MPNFSTFFSSLLSAVSDFLMSEPINYFVGIIVLFYIAALVRYIMLGKRERG